MYVRKYKYIYKNVYEESYKTNDFDLHFTQKRSTIENKNARSRKIEQ